MKRGFTLVEVMAAVGTIGFVVMGSLTMLVTGLKGFSRTSTDADLTCTNAQAIRHITENLRNAVSVSVSASGTRIDYTLPKYASVTDPVTGEKELMTPVQSDGVARAYVVDFAKHTVTDTATGKLLLEHVASTDPDPDSTQYKLAYTPFGVGMIGSVRSVTVNLITFQPLINESRYSKYKTTVIGHNIK